MDIDTQKQHVVYMRNQLKKLTENVDILDAYMSLHNSIEQKEQIINRIKSHSKFIAQISNHLLYHLLK